MKIYLPGRETLLFRLLVDQWDPATPQPLSEAKPQRLTIPLNFLPDEELHAGLLVANTAVFLA